MYQNELALNMVSKLLRFFVLLRMPAITAKDPAKPVKNSKFSDTSGIKVKQRTIWIPKLKTLAKSTNFTNNKKQKLRIYKQKIIKGCALIIILSRIYDFDGNLKFLACLVNLKCEIIFNLYLKA